MLNKLKELFASLPIPEGLKNPRWLMMAGGGVLVLGIVFSIWNSDRGYVALYGQQENIPVAQVVEILGAESIPYRINPDNGQILVAENRLPAARMALAAKGITAIKPDGYNLMDKEEMLGSSQFIQNVRYKRSMEGELAQSIMSLDPVEAARVHLGITEGSSFVMNNKPDSSASVMLTLRYGARLTDEQVGAIVQLVAGSIPGMSGNSVRVVDQAGNLLSENYQNGGENLVNVRRGTEAAEHVKQETTKNVSSLLIPLVGQGNFRISVTPKMDLSSVEETQEQYGKDPHVSDENISKENTTNELALGVPGSLSNRPIPTPAANAQAPGAAANPNAAQKSNPSSLSSRSQEQRKYAYDRNIRHIRHPGYQLEKLQVAVALNKLAPGLKNMPAGQLESITRMVEEAAGIDKSRGDSLTLDTLVFVQPPDYTPPPLKWWEDPSIQRWAEMGGIGLLALLTLLFGVRPLMKRATARRQELLAASNAGLNAPGIENAAVGEQPDKESPLSLTHSFQSDVTLPPQGSGLEDKVEYLQMIAESETERVAEVLKQWVNSNERSNGQK
ncbi:MAG TPA: flagellar basal-body MS-ring/collar protein FliF [Scandinavium sp.]|uniref:flagellar basal-body MS-ring/collar protein FliF n=1 Tax=Scandinavium sp. TaxID=2830653 RepID=UPI002E34CD35|nr:flagellar basal-body MS-ring/collar protein FliF [Scandinavium sp.]HEX4499799.1 flagellar basal-body MS-ring/collar protein FliF [Scandinavium sp.]